MRLPNGYGSVYRLKGNRRRPWVAKKTVGWSDNGRQEYYTIGYYRTRAEAMDALAEYNKNPIGQRGDITLGEVYDEWLTSKSKRLSEATAKQYRSTWKHLEPLAGTPIKLIRKSHLQEIVDRLDDEGFSYSMCHKAKVLAGQLFKHAMADSIVTQNYAELLELPEDDASGREPFTDLEIRKIEQEAETDVWAGTILIMIYTGMRITEMLTLTKFNIDIENMFITGGIKTPAGKNRVIPIHPKIRKHILYWYNQSGVELLIHRTGKKIDPKYYRKYLYYPVLERLGIRRLTPHSARHTFATMLNRADANPKAAQALMGHADFATTQNIYTHVDLIELRKAIESL